MQDPKDKNDTPCNLWKCNKWWNISCQTTFKNVKDCKICAQDMEDGLLCIYEIYSLQNDFPLLPDFDFVGDMIEIDDE